MNTGRRTTHFTSDAPVPLYFQIQAKILQEIESGRLQPGSMIPTERQLATLYRISIGTVKKAILNLVGQGYLYRTQGKGTFVAGTVLARESLRYYRLLQTFNDVESDLRVKPLQVKKVPGFSPVSTYLGLEPGQKLFELKRVFYRDEDPVVHSISYFPQHLFPDFDSLCFSEFEKKTLYITIEEKYGLPTISNRELIGIAFPDRETAAVLSIRPHQPVLFIEMLAFTYTRPYEYRRAYCATGERKLFREY